MSVLACVKRRKKRSLSGRGGGEAVGFSVGRRKEAACACGGENVMCQMLCVCV